MVRAGISNNQFIPTKQPFNKLVSVRHTGARVYLVLSVKQLNVAVQAFFATAPDIENGSIG
tara:strand:- start:258 stop:440 length:183 start_codon:yes stop_codon:yes gene_type:complete